MRKLFRFIIINLVVVGFTNCEHNDDSDAIKKSLLEKSWIQSYEEKTSEAIEIFRPSDYKEFPLSRYRQIFHFYENKICDYRVLAANDGHYMASGSWMLNSQKNTITIYNSENKVLYVWEVVELKDTILKMKAKNLTGSILN